MHRDNKDFLFLCSIVHNVVYIHHELQILYIKTNIYPQKNNMNYLLSNYLYTIIICIFTVALIVNHYYLAEGINQIYNYLMYCILMEFNYCHYYL